MTQSIPQDFIQDLLARADIVALVQRRITLKKMGTNHGACCPFHQEKTPSFTVSASKQFYHCFGCGAHGNAIGFLMAYDRLQFIEAVEELAHYLGVPLPTSFSSRAPSPQLPLYALLEKIAQYYQAQRTATPKACAYVHMRGLSDSILTQFGVGFAPAGWSNVLQKFAHTPEIKAQLLQTGMLIKNDQGKIYDRFRDRLMVPIRDHRGRVVAFGGRTLGDDTPKYLNSPETPLFHKGDTLFGLYEAGQSKQKFDFCLIVEGYMDVMMLHQFGITQAVGTMGTAISEKHLRHLIRHTKNLIFCFDGDAAGQAAAWRALENSLPLLRDDLQIRFMFLPETHDPDSILRQEGAAAFAERIAQATALSDFFFQKLSIGLDLHTPDGKAKLAQLAKEPLQNIPEGVFYDLMLQRLGEYIGMSSDMLMKHMSAAPPPTHQPAQIPTDTLLFPVQIAIALLLQCPHLAERIPLPSGLSDVKLPGVPILLKLFAQLKETPTLSVGALLEPWRESKAADQLAKLAVWKLITPPDGMEAELLGALYKIITQDREIQIQALQKKMLARDITAEEKTQLIQLLQARH